MPDLKHWSRRELAKLRQDMDRMFERTCVDLGINGFPQAPDVSASLWETGEEVLVRFSVSGLGADDLLLTVAEQAIVLEGCVEQTMEGCTTSHRFRKELGLPHRVHTESARAELAEGTLEVRMTKLSRNVPMVVTIRERN